MSYFADDTCFPPDVLAKIKDRRQAMLTKLREYSQKEDKLLFDLQWLTPSEVKQTYRSLRRKSWQMSIELMVLFLVMSYMIILAGAILGWLLGL